MFIVNSSKRLRVVLAAGVAFAALCSDMAAAQTKDAIALAGAETAKIEELIVVTARRRVEALQDVPMAVTVLGGEELARRGAANLRDIGGAFPGVSFNDSNSSGGEFTIRGLNSAGSGSDSSIGVYIDEVFVGAEQAAGQRLLDIESFQLLRGPQGTVFGRNTVAGAVNIVTRKPENGLGADLSATVGNYNLKQYGVVVNVPIVDDRLLTRLSYVKRKREGYLANDAAPGEPGNNENGETWRAQILARPTESLDVLLSLDSIKDNGCENMFRLVGGRLFTGVTDPDRSAWDGPCESDREAGGVSLRVDQRFDTMAFSSISAFRKRDTSFLTDRDFTVQPILSTGLNSDEDILSQEFRLVSTGDRALNWAAGLYYFQRDFTQDTILDLGPGFLGPGKRNIVTATAHTETQSWAAYASAEYRITDAWRAELGLRYTYETKDLEYMQTATLPIPGFGVVAPFKDKTDGGEWSPTFTLSYHLNDDAMLYGRLARGYKSSGFNTAASSNPSRIAFDPEFVNSYELGYRAAYLDGRVRVDGNVFYLDYKSIQVADQDGAGFYIGNAAAARSFGAELQLNARLNRFVDLSAGAGYVDAQYEEYGARSGNAMPRAPRWTGSLALDMHAPATGGKLFVAPEIFYRSKNFVDSANTPLFAQPAHTLVNLRAGYRHDDGWSIAAWGRNLTDERFNLGGFAVAPLLFAVTTSPPPTYGVDLRWEF
jgi:iron complex outermembrane receptor protein